MHKKIEPDEAARIIKATKNGKNARKPDPATLALGIEQCAHWYLEAKQNTERNYRLLSPIRKAAKRLDQLLADQRLPLSEIDQHRALIKKLIKEIDSALRHVEDGPGRAMQQDLSNRSPFEWIAGNFLADVYALNFRQPPSYSVTGPFVRFVESTLDVLQITNNGAPYSRSSISKARKDDKKGISRRNAITSRDDDYRFWRRAILLQAFKSQGQNDKQ